MPEPLPFHPLPVPCRGCGTVLEASYAAESGFCCPVCGEAVCWTCGCVEGHACAVEVSTLDGSHSEVLVCGWAAPGCCTFCASRAAYEFYQEATGRPADDPYYLALAPSVRPVKGLGWGV
jgi:hypothetical protein